MGQRLCLEIKYKGKPLANAYYHWGAYTGSTCEYLIDAMDYLVSHDTSDKLLSAVRALENTGAGFSNEKELDKLNNNLKYLNESFSLSNSRNDGLIAWTPRGMQDTHDWMEGYASIELSDFTVYSDVFNFYDSLDEVREYFEDTKDIVEYIISFDSMSMDDFEHLVNLVQQHDVVKIDENTYISELA